MVTWPLGLPVGRSRQGLKNGVGRAGAGIGAEGSLPGSTLDKAGRLGGARLGIAGPGMGNGVSTRPCPRSGQGPFVTGPVALQSSVHSR